MNIGLCSTGPYGERQFVDNEPIMGLINPDWFNIYTVGYNSRPIPEFSQTFVNQFFTRAEELWLQQNIFRC